MPAPIYPTTAAAPLLFLGLQKIARTPTPRLEVGYRIQPRYDVLPPPIAPFWIAGPLTMKGLRPLGQALLLDRLLAGGIVGEELPLSIAADTRPIINRMLDMSGPGQLGIFLDVWA
jgi:hypothetical protein